MIPTLLVADDHPVFLDGLERILHGTASVIGKVTDGQALLQEAARLRPDIVITDIAMPVLNGLDAVRQMRVQRLGCRVLVMSMYEEKEFALAALRAGASGYLLKTAPGNELGAALRAVQTGNIFVDRTISRGEMFEFEQAARQREESSQLTCRERAVLQLLAEGKTIKEIAGSLRIASRTVVFHKTNIRSKLGLHTTAELTRYAVRSGMVTLCNVQERRPCFRER